MRNEQVSMTPELQHKIEAIINRNLQGDDREVVAQLKQLLYEAELRECADKGAKSIADLVAENLHANEEEMGRSALIEIGFEDFDAPFGGFRLGEFVVVGGRPSMGKTQFLVNLSLHISQTTPVLYVTLDLSADLLTSRFMASVSGVPASDILHRNLNEEQKNKVSSIGDAFTKRKLFIQDACNGSIAALKAQCLKQVQENGVQVVIVDYLQLMTSLRYRNQRELEVSSISRELKRLAKECNICVIASSQLSRAVETRYGSDGKRPLLSDLRESGAIEQDADKVLFIHRPEYYGTIENADGRDLINQAEVIVAKNRNGRVGNFWIERDKDFTTFRNIKKNLRFSPDRLLELESDTPF